MYEYARTRDPDRLGATFSDENLSLFTVNIVMILNTDGDVIFAKGFDLNNDAEVSPSDMGSAQILGEPGLVHHADERSRISGLLPLDRGPLLVASRPILTAAGQGPVRGAFVSGWLLDDRVLGRISQAVGQQVSLTRFDADDSSAAVLRADGKLGPTDPIAIQTVGDDLISGFGLVTDLHGEAFGALRIDLPRDIRQLGGTTFKYVAITVLVIGLFIIALVLGVVNWTVLRPILRLRGQVGAVGASGNASQRIPITRGDEIGQLGQEINMMLAKLESSESARQRREGARWMMLGDTTLAISGESKMVTVTESVAALSAKLVGAQFAALAIINDAGELSHFVPAGELAAGAEIQGLPSSTLGVVGQLLAPGATSLRLDALSEHAGAYGFPPGHPAVQCLIGVPLIYEGSTIGALYVADHEERRPFNDAEEEILKIFALHAAMAIENVRLSEMVAADVAEQRALEAQLQHAQRMEAVGTLAAGVAHDFNNILTVVRISLDEAAAAADPATLARIDRVQAAASSASDLARQLLRIGRVGSGPHEATRLAPIVSEVLTLFARTVHPNIRFESRVSDDLLVDGTAAQLQQVILNLALNACDAMPQGGVLKIRASMSADTPPGLPTRRRGYVLLTVEDNGTGMDAETCRRVFDPFFTTKGERGSGLGGTMVYGIIREHAGSVTIDSALGRGTIVSVSLPAGAPPPASARQSESPPVSIAPAQPRSIMVVDDMATLRRDSAALLERAGYQVTAVASGREAVRRLESQGGLADLVILDCSMPGLSGRETFDAISDLPRSPKVLFISGYTFEILDGLTSSTDWAFLQKPFDTDALLVAVRALLDGNGG